jgi:hypothetical protein
LQGTFNVASKLITWLQKKTEDDKKKAEAKKQKAETEEKN